MRRAEEYGKLHAGSHRPIEQRRLLQVADAVGVERDIVVAEEHLACDFDVHGVGVIQQRGREKREAGVKREPQQQDAEQRGAWTGWDDD